MYAIAGATGNTGRAIAEKLLGQGKKVRVLGRSAERLASLASKGAEPYVGELGHDVFLREAFAGCEAVYAMIPPNYATPDFRSYQAELGKSIVSALEHAKPKYVVHLSSVGADVAQGTGPIAGLYHQEQRLNQLPGIHVLHLRPTFFFENFLANIDMVKNMHILGSAIRADLQFAMIATQDIGEYAAKRLAALDFSGKSVQILLGQRHLAMTEVTRILGKAIGKPDLKYVQFPYEDAIKGMVQAGLTEDLASIYVEMAQAFNEGKVEFGPRDAESTTPTSIEAFAEVFAQIYNG